MNILTTYLASMYICNCFLKLEITIEIKIVSILNRNMLLLVTFMYLYIGSNENCIEIVKNKTNTIN